MRGHTMQTIQFIQTVKWIKSQFRKETCGVFLDGDFFGELQRFSHKEGLPPDIVELILMASHDLAMVQPKLVSHLWAGSILNAFGMSELLDSAFPVKLAKGALGREESGGLFEMVQNSVKSWRVLWGSIGPIEKITTPKEIVEEKDFDDILTIELRRESNANPTIETLGQVLKDLNALYTNIAQLQGAKDAENLIAIYAASGSSFRFDFKGLGEPIKQIKQLLIEGWQAIRHRNAGDLRSNNKAALLSLKVLDDIASKRDKRAITDEDAAKLCQKIVNATLNLYENGGLIREIPVVEEVPNQKLIEALQPKRLPAPATKELPEGEATKKKVKKVKSKTKEKSDKEGQQQ